ncbi:MAG: hypothetical protein SGI88_07870 [Candidatus Hydrogenedentes bacterium]|nr:hypothetical protein [Candidatus Hydrogenedentota bacterium]
MSNNGISLVSANEIADHLAPCVTNGDKRAELILQNLVNFVEQNPAHGMADTNGDGDIDGWSQKKSWIEWVRDVQGLAFYPVFRADCE